MMELKEIHLHRPIRFGKRVSGEALLAGTKSGTLMVLSLHEVRDGDVLVGAEVVGRHGEGKRYTRVPEANITNLVYGHAKSKLFEEHIKMEEEEDRRYPLEAAVPEPDWQKPPEPELLPPPTHDEVSRPAKSRAKERKKGDRASSR